MSSFTLLDQVDEDNLHAKRLLNIEEKSFKRVSKRLLGPTNPIQIYLARRTSDNISQPDDDGDISTEPTQNGIISDEEHAAFLKSLARFRHDCILDFASFDSSIARIQFLRAANERERARYANEKEEIEKKAQFVRDNAVRLRLQLEEAQRTMEIRKGYDVLADKVMKEEKTKKTRDELRVGSEKLKGEIEELESEGIELQNAWRERRDQLSIIMIEATRLRRVVRDEKEPEHEEQASKDEGDEGDRDRDDEEGLLGVREREVGSNVGTPRPMEDAPTPLPGVHESGGMTPRSTLGDTEVSSPKPITSMDDVKQDEVAGDIDMADGEEAHNGSGHIGTKVGDDMDTT